VSYPAGPPGAPGPDRGFAHLGRVIKARGVRGEVLVELFFDYVERFAESRRVFVRVSGEQRELHVTRARPIGKRFGITFEEIQDRDDAEGLAGAFLDIPENEVPPAPEGSFRRHELLQMEVYTVDGRYLGTIEDVFPTGSNEVYVVRSGDAEYLIPAIDDVIQNVDVENRRMTIDPLPGLLEL
jgi:16S rRNA processing protein RimM